MLFVNRIVVRLVLGPAARDRLQRRPHPGHIRLRRQRVVARLVVERRAPSRQASARLRREHTGRLRAPRAQLERLRRPRRGQPGGPGAHGREVAGRRYDQPARRRVRVELAA